MKLNLLPLNKYLIKKKNKFILISTVCLTLYGIYIIYVPRIIELKYLKNKLNAISDEKLYYSEINKAQLNKEQILTEHGGLMKFLPQNQEIPEFLTSLETLANKNDITIDMIYPIDDTTADIEDVTVNVLSFEIKCSGEQKLLLKFLSELENEPRISKIYEIDLKAPTDRDILPVPPWEQTIKMKFYHLSQY